jgi:hypothetical protein
MKKTKKKLALEAQTVRTLESPQILREIGGALPPRCTDHDSGCVSFNSSAC